MSSAQGDVLPKRGISSSGDEIPEPKKSRIDFSDFPLEDRSESEGLILPLGKYKSITRTLLKGIDYAREELKTLGLDLDTLKGKSKRADASRDDGSTLPTLLFNIVRQLGNLHGALSAEIGDVTLYKIFYRASVILVVLNVCLKAPDKKNVREYLEILSSSDEEDSEEEKQRRSEPPRTGTTQPETSGAATFKEQYPELMSSLQYIYTMLDYRGVDWDDEELRADKKDNQGQEEEKLISKIKNIRSMFIDAKPDIFLDFVLFLSEDLSKIPRAPTSKASKESGAASAHDDTEGYARGDPSEDTNMSR